MTHTNTTERDALLPCPFCGQAPSYQLCSKYDAPLHLIRHCNVTIEKRTFKDAASAWNRRTANASEASDTVVCPNCDGKGADFDEVAFTCPRCHGKGTLAPPSDRAAVEGVTISVDIAKRAVRAMELCERESSGWLKYAEPIKAAIGATIIAERARASDTNDAAAAVGRAPDEPESYERRIAQIGCRCTRPDARCCAGDRGETGDSCTCECHREQDDRRPWDAAPPSDRAAVEGVTLADAVYAWIVATTTRRPSAVRVLRAERGIRDAYQAYERARASDTNAALKWALDQGDSLAQWCNVAGDALLELMAAYERKVRSACATPEEIAKEPWRCSEYIKAENALRGKPVPIVNIPAATKDTNDAAAPVGQASDDSDQRDYLCKRLIGIGPYFGQEAARMLRNDALLIAELRKATPPTPRAAYRQPTIKDARAICQRYDASNDVTLPSDARLMLKALSENHVVIAEEVPK
jgi:hypothetical protein